MKSVNKNNIATSKTNVLFIDFSDLRIHNLRHILSNVDHVQRSGSKDNQRGQSGLRHFNDGEPDLLK